MNVERPDQACPECALVPLLSPSLCWRSRRRSSRGTFALEELGARGDAEEQTAVGPARTWSWGRRVVQTTEGKPLGESARGRLQSGKAVGTSLER